MATTVMDTTVKSINPKEDKKNKDKYSKRNKEENKYLKQNKEENKYSEKIKRKACEKIKKKDNRNEKLQEKKKVRVQQLHEKKLVSDMVELIRIIFPQFTDNDYLRKYFNLNQCIKLEMFDEFKAVKEIYAGNNDVFIPVIKSLVKKMYLILNPNIPEEDYINEKYETNKEKFNELLLLYIKG
jgi:hypothetical protein